MDKVIIEKLFALKALALESHYYCEDSWYSCPKAEYGCADVSQGTDCNCGTDKHNEKVEKLWKEITASLLIDT